VRRQAFLLRLDVPVPYAAANEAMHRLAERRLADEIPDTVILLQHLPVFTAGRRARPDERPWSPAERAARGAEVHRIDRGGAFTFHGPGQLVGYPILDLGPKPDAAEHLRCLEEVVIRTAADLGVALHRRTDVQTGVWHGDDKVAAIGVRLMRARVTLHGFALNCHNDLSFFEGIVACGLPGHGATSLTRLAGRDVTVDEARRLVERHLADVFGLRFAPAPAWLAPELAPVAV
jgi:lipoyl(octanoyl) transferase